DRPTHRPEATYLGWTTAAVLLGAGFSGGRESTRIAARSKIDRATAASPMSERERRPATAGRSRRGRTTKWWKAPHASARETSPSLIISSCPYRMLHRSWTAGKRSYVM